MGWHVPAANVAYYETTFVLDHYSLSLVKLWELTDKNREVGVLRLTEKKKKEIADFTALFIQDYLERRNFI